MTKDNVRLALIIAGVWGSLIIAAIGTEALVHDGAIATTIVQAFAWVLGTLVVAVAGMIGVSQVTNAKVATSPIAAAVNAAAGALGAAQPAPAPSDPAGTGAVNDNGSAI